MFGMFKARQPLSPSPAARPPAPSTPQPSAPQPSAPQPAAGPTLDPYLPGLVMQELIAALARGNSFQGGCDRLPGWTTRSLPDGIEVAQCRAHLAGAFLARQQAALMFAGLDAARTAMVPLGSVLSQYLKAEPDWQTDAQGAWVGSVPLAPGFRIAFDLKNAQIDPLSTGKTLSGLQMVVRVERG
jgi:hypothetical protein